MNVSTEVLGTARIVSWDNQRHRNAWGGATIEAIADAVQAATTDADVRCIVVRGAGADFSAGDDLFEAAGNGADAFAATIDQFQRLTQVVLESPVPVIAAIDGVCIGGALEFAASCDLRVATDRARFATPEVGIGLVATNAGTLLLPEVLGEIATRELLLTGELRDAQWARRHRFVSEVVAPDALDERIGTWTARVDAPCRAPRSRARRRWLNARLGDLVATAMEREQRACVELFDSPDARGALQAFAQRRG
jgi:enoyl-CoA hydratase